MTYSLYRTRDYAGDTGGMSLALIPTFDMDTNIPVDIKYVNDARPQVGTAMRVGSIYGRSYSTQDWWQTTLITKILKEWVEGEGADFAQECVLFRTRNSEYVWKKF